VVDQVAFLVYHTQAYFAKPTSPAFTCEFQQVNFGWYAVAPLC